MPPEVLKRAERVLEMSRQSLSSSPDDSPLPMFHLFKGENLSLIASPWANNTEKALAAEFVRQKCLEFGTEIMIFCCESFGLNLTSKEEYDQFTAERARGLWKEIRKHPKAEECVLLTCENKFYTWVGKARINRSGDKAVLEPVVWGANASGVMTGILNRNAR
jgi:hypothetical protein